VAGERDVTIERALEIARGLAPDTGVEEVPVPEAAGRLLATDVLARRDLPPADVSAMDGWAVRAADTPGPLRAAGESAAGTPWAGPLRPGEAIAISTGAAMPPGADAVARREVVDAGDGSVRVREPVAPARDVRRRGELVREGGLLLATGHRVAPHEVGAIGAAGHAVVPCLRRPRVAVLATGAELVPLGAAARPAEVHDSSRHGIAAQLAAAGGEPVAGARVRDDLDATVRALEELLAAGPDVLVTCGGISAGAHDHVRAALGRLGFEEEMRGVRATPIRPTWLGRRDGVVALGLSGNPASAAVAAHLLGRPLLRAPEDWWRRSPLLGVVPGRGDRPQLIRCAERPGGLEPMAHQGAHAITSLTGATALAWVPSGGAGTGDEVAFSRMA
jgi:molybdopterin molybdotransferase